MGGLFTRFKFMRKLQFVTLFAIFLMVMSASTLFAQGRDTRTGSAKAAYGYPAERFSAKKKKAKKRKKQPKTRNKKSTPLYRKKSPWVNWEKFKIRVRTLSSRNALLMPHTIPPRIWHLAVFGLMIRCTMLLNCGYSDPVSVHLRLWKSIHSISTAIECFLHYASIKPDFIVKNPSTYLA